MGNSHCDETISDRQAEREQMVREQIITRGINNSGVIKSMLEVPRHRFVAASHQSMAYMDGPLPIGEGQTISQPYIVALMAAVLEPQAADRFLEIGTGSGYAAAVLSRLVSVVYTIERCESLARQAQARFNEMKYDNIKVRIGDGSKGWPEEAPFDGILVSAGAPGIPDSLIKQLKPGGRMVIPAGPKSYQQLTLVKKDAAGEIHSESIGTVVFVPLIGKEGWSE
ncbi:protein-L-isoaspartate(D-aspartate) O-methyltransferase [Pelotomaculum propionicicum]|uniref:Protein-L-isoaspartate O-methyltransferase n=1 Tax=Pelotomaculum propionicicum TaxID=258475 RepID=A0A4Y7RPP4_9FIRM|nr:protein-L-isoaspartate(D-aspartate) O-methyltransferase [Pelotomaculum propionicicum]TEB10710.1 Protein-L-isoaspartate O-methyltransferase [Pelotomaculum propionicicum]